MIKGYSETDKDILKSLKENFKKPIPDRAVMRSKNLFEQIAQGHTIKMDCETNPINDLYESAEYNALVDYDEIMSQLPKKQKENEND